MNRRWEDDKKQMKKASYPSQLATFLQEVERDTRVKRILRGAIKPAL